MSKSKRRPAPPVRPERPTRPTRQRRPGWTSYWPVAAIGALIVAAIAGLYLYTRSGPAAPAASSGATATVVDEVTHLDLNRTAAVGSGGRPNPFKPTHSSQPLVGPGGHPAVVYVGAEYCPYCAAERWSLVIALARFGTFSGLELSQSSSTDIYPNTPTLTFAKSTYQSSTLDFESVETSDRNQRPLQQPTAAQRQLMQAYDAGGSIPFLLIANRQYEVGSGYLPDSLQGQSWEQVARALQDPSTPLATQVLGNANWITAAICQATGDAAGPACSVPQIRSLEGQLGS